MTETFIFASAHKQCQQQQQREYHNPFAKPSILLHSLHLLPQKLLHQTDRSRSKTRTTTTASTRSISSHSSISSLHFHHQQHHQIRIYFGETLCFVVHFPPYHHNSTFPFFPFLALSLSIYLNLNMVLKMQMRSGRGREGRRTSRWHQCKVLIIFALLTYSRGIIPSNIIEPTFAPLSSSLSAI